MQSRAFTLARPVAPVQAGQQPNWNDHPALPAALAALTAAPPLISVAHLALLIEATAAVAAGHARLLQLGDCAESLQECTPAHTENKLATLNGLADQWETDNGLPVVRVGRLGGQLAKPRSSPTELHDGQELPAFRGHLINSETPTPSARRHDPRRLTLAYDASATVLRSVDAHRLRRQLRGTASAATSGPWSSHEALVLDYEQSLLRTDATGRVYLASTHLPWVGLRTNQPGLPHVRLLAEVLNPVACKVGPDSTPDAVLALCAALDPDRTPGRLTLIARLGAHNVAHTLPDLVSAVRRAGHPVIWLSDPMHGNTVRTASGLKTRHLTNIHAEVRAFHRVLERQKAHPGGLHLEVAADAVTECIGGSIADERQLHKRYTTLCDPRLNPEQAAELLADWT